MLEKSFNEPDIVHFSTKNTNNEQDLRITHQLLCPQKTLNGWKEIDRNHTYV